MLMMGDAAGLRRRRQPPEDPGIIGAGRDVRIPPPVASPTRNPRPPQPAQGKLSRLYCVLSACAAATAIVTAPNLWTLLNTATHATVASPTTTPAETSVPTLNPSFSTEDADWNWFKTWTWMSTTSETQQKKQQQQQQQEQQQRLPAWIRWIVLDFSPDEPQEQPSEKDHPKPVVGSFFLDPTLLHPGPTSVTDLIDKILTSTPRLLAIANLLLVLTYLLHSAVADWFLGHIRHDDWNSGGRERLGGFLVFKLLLISAVVAPDTLDLLILLSWYTLLSFLRSLAQLCAGTTQHTSQSGQAPRPGVLQLLLVVLLSDFCAAAVCVALFHGAGWGMVLLLTCDCALLAVDVVCHILQHVGQVLEMQHGTNVSGLEVEQIRLHRQQQPHDSDSSTSAPVDTATTAGIVSHAPQEETLRVLDRRMEQLEQQQARRLAILDATVFSLQLLAHTLTLCHFMHIWTLHGVQFTLIDGVLALHLHSALSSVSKKIAERRNLHRIARDLDGLFENASELDLRKAATAGDVCCICLGGMTIGNVKKVGCGHLYHQACLREVVERARSMEAARCPLCRASVLDGRHSTSAATRSLDPVVMPRQRRIEEPARLFGSNNSNGNSNNNAGTNDIDGGRENGPQRERALFRFSTEEVFPAWVPLPAFSFEVVRRPSAATHEAAGGSQQDRADVAQGRLEEGESILRRFLVLAGAVPMTPEAEQEALEQLVDMFPQYDRADLLRGLRSRGSPEGVAESILAGSFVGVPRGGMVPR